MKPASSELSIKKENESSSNFLSIYYKTKEN